MPSSLFIEAPLENDHDWLEPYELVEWQPYVSLRADNADVDEQYGSNWGARRIAEFLATKPRHMRSIKLGWIGSGWLKHIDRRVGFDNPFEYTNDDKLFSACRDWMFDTSVVAPKVKRLLQILLLHEATDGLYPYGEIEDEPFLQTPTLSERLLDDPQCMVNIQRYGGPLVADASRDETLAAMNWQGWSVRAKQIREPFIIAGRQLVAQTVGRLLKQAPRAYKGIRGFVLSNYATFQAKDQNGHRLPPLPTGTPKHIPMIYLHNPDGLIFDTGESALMDTNGLLRASRARPLTINVHAGQQTPAEMAWRISLATRAPAIIFGDNPVRTKHRIIETLELLKD